jgi:hypothetical protein
MSDILSDKLSKNSSHHDPITQAAPANNSVVQLELEIERPKERDRNFHVGGRSFYFFDFDDNVAHLNTPLYIFHRETGETLKLSTQAWITFHSTIGKINSPYADYEIRYDDQTGSFRDFRDVIISEAERLIGKKQTFVKDIEALLNVPDLQWKGPSWDCFYHATFNQRPVGIITARGHRSEGPGRNRRGGCDAPGPERREFHTRWKARPPQAGRYPS